MRHSCSLRMYAHFVVYCARPVSSQSDPPSTLPLSPPFPSFPLTLPLPPSPPGSSRKSPLNAFHLKSQVQSVFLPTFYSSLCRPLLMLNFDPLFPLMPHPFQGNKSFIAFSNLGDTESLTKTWKVRLVIISLSLSFPIPLHHRH